MTGLLADDEWKRLPPAAKLVLRNRLAEEKAKAGLGSCSYVTPGDMAVALDRNIVQRPHLEKIDLAFQDCMLGRTDRILITTPPQVGKSVRAGVWAPFWYLAHRPRSRIIVATYGTNLSNSRGRAVRRLVEEHGAPFGLQLDMSTTAANDWALSCGGAMRSVGVGGGLTGHPADIAIVDDPHKDRAEADSPTIRDNIGEWWSSTLISRLAPGAPAVLIMTRWHPDDLAGRLLRDEGRDDEGGRWRVVDLPAMATDHQVYEDGTRKCQCPAGIPHDPLGRMPGEPLPHPRIPLWDTETALKHWQDKKRSSNVRDWNALYQADPTPAEGALVDAETLRRQRFYGEMPAVRRTAVTVDPGGGGRDEVGIAAGSLCSDKRLWWRADWSGRMKSDVWPRRACELALEVDADVIVFEHNYGGDQAKTLIGLAWEALAREGKTGRKLKPRVVAVHAKRGKLLRAEPVAQALVEDKIRMNVPMHETEGEWQTWQPDQPWSPARIDVTTYLAYELLPIAGSDAVISTPGRTTRAEAAGRALPQTAVHIPRDQLGRGVVNVPDLRIAR